MSISSPTRNARVKALVDTGVSGYFIDMRLDRFFIIDYAPEDHFLGAFSEPMQCASYCDLLKTGASGHKLSESSRAIPGLI